MLLSASRRAAIAPPPSARSRPRRDASSRNRARRRGRRGLRPRAPRPARARSRCSGRRRRRLRVSFECSLAERQQARDVVVRRQPRVDRGRAPRHQRLVVGGDDAARRTAEGLVGRERHHVGAFRERRLEPALRDQAGDVRGVVEQTRSVIVHAFRDRGDSVWPQHQARPDDDEHGALPVEEGRQPVDVDVELPRVVRQLDDAEAADARGADLVVAQVAAGPFRQHRERVARPSERGVDGEVRERRARRSHVGESRADHLRDGPRHRHLDDVERLEARLVLVAGIPHAGLAQEARILRLSRARDVAAGVEQQRLLVDPAQVLPGGVAGCTKRIGEVGRQRALDGGEPFEGGGRCPRRRGHAVSCAA